MQIPTNKYPTSLTCHFQSQKGTHLVYEYCKYRGTHFQPIRHHPFSFIIKRIIMGCGAVCGTITINSSNHSQLSKNALNDLTLHLNPTPPLLTTATYTQFCTSLKQGDPCYILHVGQSVSSDQEISESVRQKWKIVLYGLFKSDEEYKRCLGFSLRNQKQPTVSHNLDGRNATTDNPSYHEVKLPTEYHACFGQIEKDLNRTFEFRQETKSLFERVLKKISNHFPSMGYTQGVNFVVGYLLILGYSESDTFWMFVHLAINRKYLLLGLYEDDFPLAVIYTLIFKNLLRRYDLQLYHHLYEVLVLEDSVWIFKWFITYFIYSFPLQTIKYVWDIAVELGGLGLVYYAVALVRKLRDQLLKIGDACDISEFLQSLKTLHNFNKYIKIKEVVQLAYETKLKQQDFEGIETCKPSFYKSYFQLMAHGLASHVKTKNNSEDSTLDSLFVNDQPTTQQLHRWYAKLHEERAEFLQRSQEEKNLKEIFPEILKEQYESLQKSIQLLQQKFVQNQSQRFTQRVIEEKPTSEIISNKSNPMFEIEAPGPQSQSQHGPNFVPKTRLATTPSYDISEQIDEMQGQSDSMCDQIQISRRQVQSKNEAHPSQPSIYYQGPQTYNKPCENIKITMLISQLQNNRMRVKQTTNKANMLKITSLEFRSGLSLAGQNILNNCSITNSQLSSNEAKNAAVKPRKYKENNIARYNVKNTKVRAQTVSQASHPSNSTERESSQKDSLSGFSQRQGKKERLAAKVQDYLERKTQRELMVISHGPEARINEVSKDLASEIELFNGEGLFKKKKRTNRNSIVTDMTQELELPARAENTGNMRLHKFNTYNEEESLESIIELSSIRKPKNNTQDILYEIESIK